MKIFPAKSLLVAAVALFAPLGHAASTTIVDNITSGYGDYYWSTNSAIGQQFKTDSLSYNLDSVTLLLSSYFASSPGGISVGIYSDTAGSLGSLLAVLNPATAQDTWFLTHGAGLPWEDRTNVQFITSSPVMLTANTEYWIGLTNPNGFGWLTPNYGQTLLGPGSFGVNTAGYPTPFGTTVTGTAAVPEPSTYALLGLGALGLVIACRCRVA